MEYGKKSMEKIKKRKIPRYQESEDKSEELPRKKIKAKKVDNDSSPQEIEPEGEAAKEITEKENKVEIHYDKSLLADYIKKVKENSAELIDETLVLRFEEVLRSTIKSFAEETILPIVKERSQELLKEKKRFKRLAKMCADKKAIEETARLKELDVESLKIEMMSSNNYAKAYLAVFEEIFKEERVGELMKEERERMMSKLDIEDVFILKIL